MSEKKWTYMDEPNLGIVTEDGLRRMRCMIKKARDCGLTRPAQYKRVITIDVVEVEGADILKMLR